MTKKVRWHQILIAIDQLFNALFSGWADETISARAYRCSTKSKKWYYAMKFINGIFFWQNHHCRGAYAQEKDRWQLPAEYRGEVK